MKKELTAFDQTRIEMYNDYVRNAGRDADLKYILDRRSGRSTALALQFIGEAMSNPNKEVVVWDHHPDSNQQLLNYIKGIVKKLGLDNFTYHQYKPSIMFELLDLGEVK